ncbi:hypothetical protein BDN70DRAFT_919562 [Pholiota conissans]|uniref:Uncharacterized protein n=1 Tax=Pholiota conissans TaxID=109636 RepID=A0A9P5Z7U1_9AGAR|nr:hypothetical protein BDN70DRAFT_919562 [Pholiota conissans]
MDNQLQVRKLAPLCDVCQKLDLWKTNNREDAEYDLGTWEDVKRKARKRPRCPFCVTLRLLAETTYGYESGDASIKWRDDGGFWSDTYGDTLVFLNEETATSPYGSGRAVQPHIDRLLLKKWLNLCETHHRETCMPIANIIATSEGVSGVKVLRVIDVKDWCIVEATSETRYLALGCVRQQNMKL